MANSAGGSVIWDLDVDSKKLKAGLASAREDVAETARNVDSNFSKLAHTISSTFDQAEESSRKFAKGLLAIGTAAVTALGFGVKMAGDTETARQGFVTLLGSAEKADEAIRMIKKDAAATPFELPGLIRANQLLSSVTKDAGRSEGILLNVGKALAAAGKGGAELDNVIVNLQQIANTGRITEMDIRQFGFAGINILELLADQYGVTKDKAGEMIKGSKDAFTDLEKAFQKAGGEGGKFSRAFIDQAGTWNQLVSNFKDVFSQTAGEIVVSTGAFSLAKNALGGLVDSLVRFQPDIVETIQKFMKFIINNGPIVTGIIVGGLAPAFLGLARNIALAMVPLLPWIAAGAAIGLAIQGIKFAFANWDSIVAAVQGQLAKLGTSIEEVLKGLGIFATVITAAAIAPLRNFAIAIVTQAIPAIAKFILSLGVNAISAVARFGVALVTQAIPAMIRFAVVGTLNMLKAIGNLQIAFVTQGIPAIARFAVSIFTVAIPAMLRFAVSIFTVAIPAVASFALTLITQTIPAVLRMATAMIVNGVQGVMAFVTSIVTTLIPALISTGTTLITQTIPSIFSMATAFVVNGVKSVAAFAVSLITVGIPAMLQFALSAGKSVVSALIAMATTIWTTVLPAIGALVVANLPLILGIATVIAVLAGLKKAYDSNFMGFKTFIDNVVGYITQGWEKMKAIFDKIKDGLDKINPFHRNSPSLIDNVRSGVAEIAAQYGSLKNISLPNLSSMAPGFGAQPAFSSFGTNPEDFNVSGGGMTEQNISVEIGSVQDSQDVDMLARQIGYKVSLLPK